MVRIGCVKYLNARPLINRWPGEVYLDTPSVLCRKLSAGELDVALVSSFEFLRNPIYRIVDGISISSDGPVYSVILAYRGELAEIKTIVLDPASATSVNLLAIVLAQRDLSPRMISSPRTITDNRGSEKREDDRVAQLLIGDQAILFRQKNTRFRFLDLGQEWKAIADLPFVYALWLVRPEVSEPNRVADELRSLRDHNLARIDQLISDRPELDPQFCHRYFFEHLRFNFGEREKAGLESFARECTKLGLIATANLQLNLV